MTYTRVWQHCQSLGFSISPFTTRPPPPVSLLILKAVHSSPCQIFFFAVYSFQYFHWEVYPRTEESSLSYSIPLPTKPRLCFSFCSLLRLLIRFDYVNYANYSTLRLLPSLMSTLKLDIGIFCTVSDDQSGCSWLQPTRLSNPSHPGSSDSLWRYSSRQLFFFHGLVHNIFHICREWVERPRFLAIDPIFSHPAYDNHALHSYYHARIAIPVTLVMSCSSAD